MCVCFFYWSLSKIYEVKCVGIAMVFFGNLPSLVAGLPDILSGDTRTSSWTVIGIHPLQQTEVKVCQFGLNIFSDLFFCKNVHTFTSELM